MNHWGEGGRPAQLHVRCCHHVRLLERLEPLEMWVLLFGEQQREDGRVPSLHAAEPEGRDDSVVVELGNDRFENLKCM